MDLPETAKTKLSQALSAVLNSFGSVVRGILLIGSASKEFTESSDLDILVVLDDKYFMSNILSIKSMFAELANGINNDNPLHPLALWPSKTDHYSTLLPDVSYVRANYPLENERLDAWCGLAKRTLINYEAGTAIPLFGDFRIDWAGKIPPWEATELFLLATRTFAEGAIEILGGDKALHRHGRNQLAKGILRAVYAVLIAHDGAPRNSYSEILYDANIILDEAKLLTMRRIHSVKMGTETTLPDWDEVIDLMIYCENCICHIPYATMAGIASAQAGESFAFDFERILTTVPPEQYRRAPTRASLYQNPYFTATSYELIRRLSVLRNLPGALINFFFEELMEITIQTMFSQGVIFHLGSNERETRHLYYKDVADEGLQQMQARLAEWLLDKPPYDTGLPWLSNHAKRAFLSIVLSDDESRDMKSGTTSIAERLKESVDIDSYIRAMEWLISRSVALPNLRAIRSTNVYAAAAMRFGRPESAERTLRQVFSQFTLFGQMADDKDPNVRQLVRNPEFRREMATTAQYLGVCLSASDRVQEGLEALRLGFFWDCTWDGLITDTASILSNLNNADIHVWMNELMMAKMIDGTPANSAACEIYTIIGARYRQKQKYTEADDAYRRALKINPSNAKALYNYGFLNHVCGNLEEAIDLLRRSINADPNYDSPYILWGYILETSEQIESAIQVYEYAATQGLSGEKLFVNMGNCLFRIGKHDDALNYFQKALHLEPLNSDALNGMGIIFLMKYELLGDTNNLERSIEYFKAAIEADPSFFGAKSNLARALAALLGVTE